MASAWTDLENDFIVEDYFAMLNLDLKGLDYNKAAHRRSLTDRIERSEGSIEYKHQNISAVLKSLGEDWIPGYKPAFNFQMSLVDAVIRWLRVNADWTDPIRRMTVRPNHMSESNSLWVGPAPTLSNQPEPAELEQTLAVARKFNVAERDEQNRKLGRAGEELALAYERATLIAAGRSDLAKAVVWVSGDVGDGAGYDIASFSSEGKERLLEVKTTNGWERTPFHISRNELSVANERRHAWVLFRIHSFIRKPQAFEIRPPLDYHVSLTPTSFPSYCR